MGKLGFKSNAYSSTSKNFYYAHLGMEKLSATEFRSKALL